MVAWQQVLDTVTYWQRPERDTRMTDPRARVSERLVREQSEFIDYSEIAKRAEERGIPVSPRTLRFYVDEGILPPPHKQGQTPVYPERRILDLLLSVHLMKSRFQRSLSEIRTILQSQREDPAVLADKCAILYEEYWLGERLPRREREWLADAFFRTLLGRLSLYPRSRRGDSGPRQAGEVLLVEMIEDIDSLSRWDESDPGAWSSPEEVLSLAKQGEGGPMAMQPTPQDSARSQGPSGSESNTPESAPTVTPLSPPTGSVTIDAARQREEHFLQRFERNVARLQRVFHPKEKKYYTFRGESLDPEVHDPYQDVVSILKENDLYDRRLLESLPHDRASRYLLPPPGIFGKKKPKLVVSGVVRSPIGELARLGGVLNPLGVDAVREVLRTEMKAAGAFYVFGILSTVGWDSDVKARLPRGEDFALVLIEQTEGGGWSFTDSLPEKLKELLPVFDPEDFTEKVSRTFYRVIEEPELQIPGGHIEVEKLLQQLGVESDVLDVALQQVTQENSRIELTEVSGRRIIKRARY